MRDVRIRLLLAAVAVSLSAAVARAQGSDGVTLTATQIDEYRFKRLVADKKYVSSSYLSVRLLLKGDGVKKLTRLGNWQITTAKDDQGNDLVNRATFTSKTLYRTYRRYATFGTATPPPQDEYETSYSLKAPNRGSKTLTAFQGTVIASLSDSDTVAIPVSKLTEMTGKVIADPLLKKAGITVTLDRYSSTSTSASLSLKFTGTQTEQEKFLRLRFEDKDGKTITESNASPGFSQGFGSLYAYRALPADGFLKFDIETKRNDVTVRFDLKDMPLP